MADSFFNRITASQLFDYEQVANADCEYPLDCKPIPHMVNHAKKH